MDSSSGGSSSSSRPAAKPKARLDRRYAMKDIDYEYSPTSTSASSSSSQYSWEESLRTRSLDLYGGKTSFRIDGTDGEMEIFCRSLGFSGIDDFCIPAEEYEMMKVRTSSAPVLFSQVIGDVDCGKIVDVSGDGGGDCSRSCWEENCVLSRSCSFTTTSNDDDCSSSTTEPMSSISPNGRFRRVITEWQKGELLGRGSFGSVYEGISDGGFFFAVKEVSLLDQGDGGKQRIIQLEQL